jgi:hypothetical protein
MQIPFRSFFARNNFLSSMKINLAFKADTGDKIQNNLYFVIETNFAGSKERDRHGACR